MKCRPTFIFFTIFTLILVGSTGCQSARFTSSKTAEDDSVHVRTPASDPTAEGDALIRKFARALAAKSSLNEADIEDAVSAASDRNFDDIAAMSDRDQRRIIDRLLHTPGFADKVAVEDLDAVRAARAEAVATSDVKSAGTESVPDIRSDARSDIQVRSRTDVRAQTTDSAAGENSGETLTFSKALEANPELKDDVAQMAQENLLIEKETGARVLDKGCDSIQDGAAVENLTQTMQGVQRDVASGSAQDTKGVSKSLEKNMGDVLGTDSPESHHRVCALADRTQCAVFTPQMCNP